MGKKKRHSPLRHRLEYLGARLASFVLRALPLPAADLLGRGLTRLLCRFDARHREQTVRQMKAALGEGITDERALELTGRMYRHFGTMLAELARLSTLTAGNIDRHVDFSGVEEALRPVLAGGKGFIFVTGHIGNWEVSGPAFVLKGLLTGAVARPLDNPLLDEYIRGMRTRSGQQIWDKFGALRKVVQVLKKNKSFAILVDQDAGQRGLFVPFFGIECSTIPTPADLALLFGSPIVVACTHRAGKPMRFRAKVMPPIIPDLTADRETERLRLLRRINEDLEALIREEPAQWLWLHRRWKTRPPPASRETALKETATPGGKP